VDVLIRYTNLDFHRRFGNDLYLRLQSDATYTSVNDWLFRREAFDDVHDNGRQYLARFYPGAATEEFRTTIESVRKDLGAFIEELIDLHDLESFDVVGINATFSTVPGMAFCRHLKKRRNGIVTVMGGATLYKEMGLALSRYYSYVDCVCSGSGLVSFPCYIGALMNGGDTESIGGILTGNNVGKVGIISEELDINHDIELDYDDFYETFDEYEFDARIAPRILMETSRGCYWRKCTFCGLNEDQLKYRVKTPEKMIGEIQKYIDRYDYDIEMVDNVMPRSFVEQVAPHISMPDGRGITYEIRSDFSEDEVQMLSEVGVKRLQPGIETFCSDVHMLMNKGVNAFQCINMLKLCVKYGILSGWNLMIGFPGMTEEMYESIAASIPRLVHLLPPIVVTPVRIDRYSYYWIDKDKYDLDLYPFSPYSYIYPYGDEFVKQFAYYFEDRNYESERLKLLVKHFGPLLKKVDEWKGKWENLDAREVPKLYARAERDGETRLYDSRGDRIRDYSLKLPLAKILTALEQPHSIESLSAAVPDERKDTIAGALEFFESERVLFSEGGRCISLVIHGYSPEATRRICSGLRRTGPLFQKHIKM
jgi:ribosomal peptide maturation radical SAM protein 1